MISTAELQKHVCYALLFIFIQYKGMNCMCLMADEHSTSVVIQCLNERTLVFHEDGYQPPNRTQFWELLIKNNYVNFYFSWNKLNTTRIDTNKKQP